MNYNEQKQLWFDKERRCKLVLAIIGKEDKQDRELIPAYNRFIETGDEEMFKLFNEFLKLKDARERANEMEKEIKRLQMLSDKLNHFEKLYEEKMTSYRDYYEQKIDERNKLCKQIDTMPLEQKTDMIGHIRDFISKAIDGKRGWTSKRLYININGKLKLVKSIALMDNGQFVLDVLTKPDYPPEPHSPESSCKIYPYDIF